MERDCTVRDLAKRFGVKIWQVQKLFERDLIREDYRVGILRMIREANVEQVERALRASGYLS